MNIQEAISLMDHLIYKPGWRFETEDHTNRFEGSIYVRVTYPAQNSDRAQAPAYAQPVPGGARAGFALVVSDVDEKGLYRRLIDDVLMPIELHEAREFLRTEPAYNAPFHPHTVAGMTAWGSPSTDMLFGL